MIQVFITIIIVMSLSYVSTSNQLYNRLRISQQSRIKRSDALFANDISYD
jgi:hypothetical protein